VRLIAVDDADSTGVEATGHKHSHSGTRCGGHRAPISFAHAAVALDEVSSLSQVARPPPAITTYGVINDRPVGQRPPPAG